MRSLIYFVFSFSLSIFSVEVFSDNYDGFQPDKNKYDLFLSQYGNSLITDFSGFRLNSINYGDASWGMSLEDFKLLEKLLLVDGNNPLKILEDDDGIYLVGKPLKLGNIYFYQRFRFDDDNNFKMVQAYLQSNGSDTGSKLKKIFEETNLHLRYRYGSPIEYHSENDGIYFSLWEMKELNILLMVNEGFLNVYFSKNKLV